MEGSEQDDSRRGRRVGTWGSFATLEAAALLSCALGYGVGCDPAYLDPILGPSGTPTDASSCPPGLQSCAGTCVALASDPDHCGTCFYACSAAEVCSLGTCSDGCAGSLVECEGACVDLETDDEHCGRCDLRCLGAASCEAGECVCPGQGTYCTGNCVNTQNSHEHCGGCDSPCDAGEYCVSGQCV